MANQSKMAASSLLTLFTLAVLASAWADCDGIYNNYSIWSQNPQFVGKVTNGLLFTADAGPGNTLRIAHIYGTAYEMGFAHGELFRSDILQFYAEFQDYVDQMIAPYVKDLPQDVQEVIEKYGSMAALEFTAALTKPYTPQRFVDEMKGLADAINMSYDEVVRVQMFPELIKASCSMIGAWGSALANPANQLLQLRALDFGIDGPFVKHPAIIVYHPTEGHSFVSVTWTGFIGSVTAFSGMMGVSEKVWIHYNLTASRAGIPFHFLLRDIGQFDTCLDDTINRLNNAKRTCSIFAGFGANHSKEFRVAFYGHEEVLVYDDFNYPSYAAHPKLQGLVYVDKHTQPSDDPCMGGLMQRYHGSFTPELIIRSVVGPMGSGDMHAAVYDFNNQVVYVSIAGSPPGQPSSTTIVPAYARPWFRFDAAALLHQTL